MRRKYTEKLWMAWHTIDESLNPEIYGTTKKQYKENLNRVTAGLCKDNYLMAKVKIVLEGIVLPE